MCSHCSIPHMESEVRGNFKIPEFLDNGLDSSSEGRGGMVSRVSGVLGDILGDPYSGLCITSHSVVGIIQVEIISFLSTNQT